jgi:membrane protein DedA with SNARE-associated domain
MRLKPGKLALFVFALFAFLAFMAFIGRALIEVSRGNGGGTYEDVNGFQVHWVSDLTLAAALFVTIVIGLALRWWQKRDSRAIDGRTHRRTKTDGEGE